VNLLIDGYWWPEGPDSNRMVLREIVRQWVDDYPDDDLTLAIPGETSAPVPDGVDVVRTRFRVHPAINFFELPLIARRRGTDAILAFNFAARARNSVVFLHDVLFQSNPEWFTRKERIYFSAMPRLAPSAHSVVTSTRAERNRIARHNPRLRHIVNSGLATPSSVGAASAIDPGLNLTDGGYLLCVGRLNVRKNLAVTLRAALESGVVSASFPLVVVGERSGRIADLDDDLGAAADAGLLRFVERVSDSELKWLYTHCALFVCMSSDEGFGLPPVEAASLGCRVLASDIPVFRETLGSYATLVDPTDVDAIADGIRAIVRAAPQTYTTDYRQQYTWTAVCEAIRRELMNASARPSTTQGNQRSNVS
jgi:glycosyltransferase involved in cell wall biosynthesis